MDDLITTPREQHNRLGTFASWSGGHYYYSSLGPKLVYLKKKNGWLNDNIIYLHFHKTHQSQQITTHEPITHESRTPTTILTITTPTLHTNLYRHCTPKLSPISIPLLIRSKKKTKKKKMPLEARHLWEVE